jgi:hypothetical protein
MLAAGAAGLAVLLRDRPRLLVASALVAGLVLPWAAPSEGRPTPLPALVLVLAAAGATLVAVGLSVRRRPDDAEPARAAATLAAVLLLAPSALLAAPRLVRAAADPAAARAESDPPVVVRSLPPALVRDLRALPPRSVVAANTAVAYLVPAVSTNVVYAAPPVHVANSPRNDPYGRERENRRLLAPGTSDEARSAILASRGIDYLVLEGPERPRFAGLVERGLARVLADRPPYRLLQVTAGDG